MRPSAPFHAAWPTSHARARRASLHAAARSAVAAGPGGVAGVAFAPLTTPRHGKRGQGEGEGNVQRRHWACVLVCAEAAQAVLRACTTRHGGAHGTALNGTKRAGLQGTRVPGRLAGRLAIGRAPSI